MNGFSRLLAAAAAVPLLAGGGMTTTGCRDFGDTRQGAATEAGGPLVRFEGLGADDVLPLRWRVALQAEDVDGVARVALACGRADEEARRPLHAWSGAPFAAEVELSPCFGDSAEETTRAVLVATAEDALGAVGEARLEVVLDRRLPQVTVEVPARVRPGGALEVRISAPPARPGGSVPALATAPAVTVDGVPRAVEERAPGLFVATITAPRPDGLEARDVPMQLVVSARSEAGNELRLTREVVSSVVAWERELPAQVVKPVLDAHRPIAAQSGLSIALLTESGSADTWIPGRVDPQTGALLIPRFDRPGTARAFASDGRPIFEERNGAGQTVHYFGGWSGQTDTPVSLQLQGPLLRLPDRTCALAVTDPCQLPTFQFQCLGGAGSAPYVSAQPAGPNVGVYVASGQVGAAFDFYGCGTGGTSNRPRTSVLWQPGMVSDPLLADVASEAPGMIARVLAAGDTGRFALTYLSSKGERVTRLTGADGFEADEPMGTGTAEVLAVRPKSLSVVAAEDGKAGTVLRLFEPGRASPAREYPLDLRLEPVGGAGELAQVSPNATAFSDDRFAMVGRTHDFGRGVLAMNADFTPAFLYRYPRGTSSLTLVHDGRDDGLLYLLDATNHRVVALWPAW